MINFRVVVAPLPSLGREENFCDTFAPECGNEVAVIIQCSIIKNAFHKQIIADILLFLFRCVPEEMTVSVDDLAASHWEIAIPFFERQRYTLFVIRKGNLSYFF